MSRPGRCGAARRWSEDVKGDGGMSNERVVRLMSKGSFNESSDCLYPAAAVRRRGPMVVNHEIQASKRNVIEFGVNLW